MGFRYAVIGSGRHGTAAAYDIARFGDSEYLLLADESLAQAERAAARVNQLIGRQVAHAVQVEVQNEDAVVSMLTAASIQVLISGVPYFYNLGLTRAAIRAHTSMCDFGGNTEQVRQQLDLDNESAMRTISRRLQVSGLFRYIPSLRSLVGVDVAYLSCVISYF